MKKYDYQYWVNSRSIIPAKDIDDIYRYYDITTEKSFRPEKVIEHCLTKEKHIEIPKYLRSMYKHLGRPTPLYRAKKLEKYLNTNNKIYLKREDLMPNGSFKINLVLPQVYFGKEEGRELAVAETSAGHVGVATALAVAMCEIKSLIFMTDRSYKYKPYRRYMMQMYGAEVLSSPSQYTDIGKKMYLGENILVGSVAKASSEVLEVVTKNPKSFKVTGSMSDQALTYNTVIGIEAMMQLKKETGRTHPDILMCCVGGGASFGGLVVPFLSEDDPNTKILAVESTTIPKLTKGKYDYDFKDASKKGKSLKMYSLGTDFNIPEMYGAGLTYHGASPIISFFVHNGRIVPKDVTEQEALEAAKLFAKLEGIIIAPECAFTMAQLIKETKEHSNKTILSCITGSGLLDMHMFVDMK